LIEPLEGAGAALATDEDVYLKSLRVHGVRIASAGQCEERNAEAEWAQRRG
jgi:hypothetical protein